MNFIFLFMRYLSLLLVFFIPIILSAQKNFRPGYIVNLEGDTTKGFIDNKEWSFTPTRISFKPLGNNANVKEYGVNDISFFDITDLETYRRSIVKISLHPSKINDISGRDTSWKIDTVFLKVIYAGNRVSLFSYADIIKERFYILEEGQQQPTELMKREYLKENGITLVSEQIYKQQLKNVLYAKSLYTDEVGNKIDEAIYDERDLKKVIALMNTTGNEEIIEEKEQRAYWFAGAGLQRDKATFAGKHQLATNVIDNNSTWLPRISAGVDLFANPNVGKFYYRIEAGYQINKSTVTSANFEGVKAVYTLSGSTLTLQSQVNYTLYNSDKIKVPVGAGIIFGHRSYSKNQYKKVYTDGSENNHVENWLDLRKSTTTYFARGSVVLHNKIEASFQYRPSARHTKTIAYSMATNNMQLQVYYLFRNRK